MKKKELLRLTLAILFAYICLLSSREYIELKGFSVVQHYNVNSAPVFSQVSNLAAQYENAENPQFTSLTAWSQKESTAASSYNGRSMTVDVVNLLGDASLVFKTEMKSGSMPSMKQDGIAIDEITADQMFGSSDAVGKSMKLNNEDYRICGVFQHSYKGIRSWGSSTGKSIVVKIAEPDEKIQSLGILLTPSSGNNIDRANSITLPLGRPAYTEDCDITALFVRQLGWLPIWIWVIGTVIKLLKTVWAYIKRPPMFDPRRSTNPQRIIDLSLRFGISAFCLLSIWGFIYLIEFAPKLPVSFLPTRWSDFSHWVELVKSMGQEWAKMLNVSVLGPDLPKITLLLSTIAGCVLALLFMPENKETPSLYQMIYCIVLPMPVLVLTYLFGFGIEFIPAMLLLPGLMIGIRYLSDFLWHLQRRLIGDEK